MDSILAHCCTSCEEPRGGQVISESPASPSVKDSCVQVAVLRDEGPTGASLAAC